MEEVLRKEELEEECKCECFEEECKCECECVECDPDWTPAIDDYDSQDSESDYDSDDSMDYVYEKCGLDRAEKNNYRNNSGILKNKQNLELFLRRKRNFPHQSKQVFGERSH